MAFGINSSLKRQWDSRKRMLRQMIMLLGVLILNGVSARGEPIEGREGGQGAIVRVAFNHAGDKVVTAGSDGTINLWDLKSKRVLRTLLAEHKTAMKEQVVSGVAFSKDGTLVLTAGSPQVVGWETATGKEVFRIGELSSDRGRSSRYSCESIALSSNNRELLFREDLFQENRASSAIKLVDVADGKLKWSEQVEGPALFKMALSSSAAYVAVMKQKKVSIWNTSKGIVVNEINDVESVLHLSDDGSFLIAAANQFRDVVLIDTKEPGQRGVFTGHRLFVQNAKLSGDGKWLISAAQDGEVKMWDVAKKTCIMTIPRRGPELTDLDVTRDFSSLIVARREKTAVIYELPSGKENGTY